MRRDALPEIEGWFPERGGGVCSLGDTFRGGGKFTLIRGGSGLRGMGKGGSLRGSDNR